MARRGGWRRVRSGKGFATSTPTATRSRTTRRWSGSGPCDPPPGATSGSPDPGAKLQAVGVDSAGRRQYRYSAAFRESQEREKYDRLIRFGERLPSCGSACRSTWRSTHARERVCAIAVRLIDLSWFRVGSERPARSRRVYGVTTLTKRHVSVRGTRVSFASRRRTATRPDHSRRRGAGRRRRDLLALPVAAASSATGGTATSSPDRAAAQRVRARPPRPRVQREGLPHLGRHLSAAAARRPRPAAQRSRGEARARRRRPARRGRLGTHGRRAGVVHRACRRRRVHGRPHAGRLPAALSGSCAPAASSSTRRRRRCSRCSARCAREEAGAA